MSGPCRSSRAYVAAQRADSRRGVPSGASRSSPTAHTHEGLSLAGVPVVGAERAGVDQAVREAVFLDPGADVGDQLRALVLGPVGALAEEVQRQVQLAGLLPAIEGQARGVLLGGHERDHGAGVVAAVGCCRHRLHGALLGIEGLAPLGV